MVDDAEYFKPNRHRYKILAAMLVLFIVTCLCALRGLQVEAILNVRFEEIDILTLDPMYFDVEQTEAFIVEDIDTEDTTITTKLVITSQLPKAAQGRLELTGLSMGEYSLDTGISLGMGLCEMLDEPVIMGPFLAVLGFTQDACPPEPNQWHCELYLMNQWGFTTLLGLYTQEGYKLPLELLPDEFPENKYLAFFEIKHKEKPILGMNIYVEIQSE